MSSVTIPGPPPVHAGAPYRFPPVTRAGALLAADLPGCPTAYAAIQFDAGIGSEPTARAGLSHLLATALRAGGELVSPEELTLTLEELGATWNTTVGDDYLLVSSVAPTAAIVRTLGVIAQAVHQPSLGTERTARLRADQLARVEANWARPGTAGTEALGRALYRTGRQTVLPHGTTGTLGAIAEPELREHHRALLASGARVVLVGDLQGIDLNAAADAAARLKPSVSELPRPSPSPAPQRRLTPGRDIVVVDRPGAAQAVVSLAHHLPLVAGSQHSALAIAVHVLGGTVHSRLTRELRDRHGQVYAVNAALRLTRDTGAFNVVTQTAPQTAASVVERILAQITDLRTHGVTAQELAGSVNLLIGRLPISFHTPGAVGMALCGLASTGAADEFHTQRHADLAKLTCAKANSAAEEFLSAEELVPSFAHNEFG